MPKQVIERSDTYEILHNDIDDYDNERDIWTAGCNECGEYVDFCDNPWGGHEQCKEWLDQHMEDNHPTCGYFRERTSDMGDKFTDIYGVKTAYGSSSNESTMQVSVGFYEGYPDGPIDPHLNITFQDPAPYSADREAHFRWVDAEFDLEQALRFKEGFDKALARLQAHEADEIERKIAKEVEEAEVNLKYEAVVANCPCPSCKADGS